jgi:hypothetical protein
MPYYQLFVASTNETLSEVAANRADALAKFGKTLGLRLTLIDQDIVAPYMLGEREENQAWITPPNIPVFEVSD